MTVIRPTIAALCILPGLAMADQDWKYTGTAYAWLPGITSTVETPFGEVEAEVEFADIFDKLDIAFLAAIEARNGRLSLIGDLQFFDLGAEALPRATNINSVEIDSKITALGGYALYAIADTPTTRFEFGGGLRYFDAEIDTEVIAIEQLRLSNDGNWVDAVVSGRLTHAFNEDWYTVAYLDVGGFGVSESSDLTIQGYVAAGYKLTDSWSALAGYRRLWFERDFDGRMVTSDVGGPIIAIQKKF